MLLVALAWPAALAGAAAIREIDEFIDAPRVVFGDALPAALARLGPPLERAAGTRGALRDSTARRPVERLRYPGLRLEFRDRLVGAELTVASGRLPLGLDVGSPRAAVEAVLGEPQASTDDRALYLYSDGFPKTVTFHFREGRVWRIEWEYWVE